MHTGLYELQTWPVFYVCPAVKVQFSKGSLSTKYSTDHPAVASCGQSAPECQRATCLAGLCTLTLQAVLADSARTAGPLGSP